MINIRAKTLAAVKTCWTRIVHFTDIQLMAVRIHKQTAANNLTANSGSGQSLKNGLIAYRANVKATIDCVVGLIIKSAIHNRKKPTHGPKASSKYI